MPSEIQVESGIPEMVQQFHSLYPLEDLHSAEDRPSIALGVQSVVFKGISIRDNQAYALRRISRRQVRPQIAMESTPEARQPSALYRRSAGSFLRLQNHSLP